MHCLCTASDSLRPLWCLSCSFAGQKTAEGLDLRALHRDIFGSDDDDECDDTLQAKHALPPGLDLGADTFRLHGQPPLPRHRYHPSGISDADRPRVRAEAKARHEAAIANGESSGPRTYAIAYGLPPPEALPRYLKPACRKQGLFYGPLAWKPDSNMSPTELNLLQSFNERTKRVW